MRQLRILAPLLIVVALGLDAAVRILPWDPWSPSAYLAAARWTRLDGTWSPNASFYAPQAYGELARLGRVLDMVRFREERFVTDRYGYRNAVDLTGKTRVIWCGSSFAMGMSLSEEDTPGAQLSRLLGEPVYNMGVPLGGFSVPRVFDVAQKLGVNRGTVLIEYVNRMSFGARALQTPVGGGDPVRLRIARYSVLRNVWPYFKGVLSPTFHVEMPFRLSKLVDNDETLPNSGGRFVMRRTLSNGEPFLFLSQDVSFFHSPSLPEITVDAFVWLQQQLLARQLELRVVLVPTSYTAYFPTIAGSSGPDSGASYMNRMEQLLTEKGVPVLNATRIVRAEAKEGLANRQYLYWTDDAHWNSRGVSIVTGEISGWIARTRGLR